jgi:hypothetical protein
MVECRGQGPQRVKARFGHDALPTGRALPHPAVDARRDHSTQRQRAGNVSKCNCYTCMSVVRSEPQSVVQFGPGLAGFASIAEISFGIIHGRWEV